MSIQIGSIWQKKPNMWMVGGGQFIIVEKIDKEVIPDMDMITYRYCNTYEHHIGSIPIKLFLNRMSLIKDV